MDGGGGDLRDGDLLTHERITSTSSRRLNSAYLLEPLLIPRFSVAVLRLVQSAVSPCSRLPSLIYRERYDGSAAVNNTAPKGQL